MGGASSSADNTLTFEDTSEFMYRNSSTDRSGYQLETQFRRDELDQDTDLTDNKVESAELLDAACRQMIKDAASGMLTAASSTGATVVDREYLTANSLKAWDRACALYPEYRVWADNTVADILAEGVQRICEMEVQWSRLAGSSLNCIVQGLKIRAETELSRKLLAERARWEKEGYEHQTKAITDAFQMELAARIEPARMSYTNAIGLLQVLRGAQSTMTADRTSAENVKRDTSGNTTGGKYWVDASVISDDQATQQPRVDENRAAVNAIQALIGV